MEKYTKLPENAFTALQMNAGLVCSGFTPGTGTVNGIIGATTGGVNFATNPTFEDFGEDVDNCPANMKELKKLTSMDPTMSGTFLSVTAALAKALVAAADIDATDTTKIVPRSELNGTDFTDIWWVGDYSDVNTGANAGYLAIHLKNALNQTGFQIQSTKNGKGQFSFEYHAHYTIDSQDEVPFEIYVKAGTE